MSEILHHKQLYVPLSNGKAKLIEIETIEYIESKDQVTDIYYRDVAGKSTRITGNKTVNFFKDNLFKHLVLVEFKAGEFVNCAQVESFSVRNMELILKSGHSLGVARRKMEDVIRVFEGTKYDVELEVTNEVNQTQIFALKPGLKLMGRKSDKSLSDILIDTSERYLSREHLLIELKKSEKGVYSCTASIPGSKQINPTTIDDKVIKSGEKYPLQNGSVITVGKIKMIMRINKHEGDKDETILVNE